MLDKFSTSKIIAIKFTIYVFFILLFFGVSINIIFFKSRYNKESKKLTTTDYYEQIINQEIPIIMGESYIGSTNINDITTDNAIPIANDVTVISGFYQLQVAITGAYGTHQNIEPTFILNNNQYNNLFKPTIEIIPYNSTTSNEIKKNHIWNKISKFDNEYILYDIKNDNIFILIITNSIYYQKIMIIISIVLIILSTLLTYFLSRSFVRSGLYRLKKLYSIVKKLNINDLNNIIPLEGPRNDEVRIIAEKLQESIETIKKQTNALKEFVANSSHELRTPLMQINSEIDYIQKKHNNLGDSLDIIKSAIKNINKRIEGLLTLAKIESLGIPFKIKENNISKLLENLIEENILVHKNNGIILEKSISPNIVKKISQEHFTLLINNLLTNAYKYTKVGGSIYIKLSDKNIIIKDSGIGIKKENLNKIRNEFWQENSESNQNSNGSGLGLSIVKKIINLYKWDIKVKSNSNGTTFTIGMYTIGL